MTQKYIRRWKVPGLRLAWLFWAALVSSIPYRAEAFILTLGHVDKMLTGCPAASTKTVEIVNAEVFAFLRSSILSGSGNLLTLGSIFVLSENSVVPKEGEYAAYTQCATERAVKFLEQSGVKVIHNIGEQESQFRNRSLAFMPTLFGDSISAYLPVRVTNNHQTIAEFEKITCDAKFSVAYVVYPLTSYQPGYEPSGSVKHLPIKNGSKIVLDRSSAEVARAIEESKDINTEEPSKSGFKNHIDANPDELWIWVFLTSQGKSCSALMSVLEVPKT